MNEGLLFFEELRHSRFHTTSDLSVNFTSWALGQMVERGNVPGLVRYSYTWHKNSTPVYKVEEKRIINCIKTDSLSLTLICSSEAMPRLLRWMPEWMRPHLMSQSMVDKTAEFHLIYESRRRFCATLLELMEYGPIEQVRGERFLLLSRSPSDDLINEYLWHQMMEGGFIETG